MSIDIEKTLGSFIFDYEQTDDSGITEFDSDDVHNFFVYEHSILDIRKITESIIKVPLFKLDYDQCNYAAVLFMNAIRNLYPSPKRRICGEVSEILTHLLNEYGHFDTIVMSSCHAGVVEKLADDISFIETYGSFTVYEYGDINIILDTTYKSNIIDFIRGDYACMVWNEDDEFGFYLQRNKNESDTQHKEFMMTFELADTRGDCLYCNNSREGQVWDINARMMVTIPDGCPRCGKAAQDS